MRKISLEIVISLSFIAAMLLSACGGSGGSGGGAAAVTWKSVAIGSSHTAAIDSNGNLWTWGLNIYGQLGDGTNNQNNTPAKAGSAADWKTIAASGDNVAIKTDGTLWA